MRISCKFAHQKEFNSIEEALAAIPGLISTGEVELGRKATIERIMITGDFFGRSERLFVTIDAFAEISPSEEHNKEMAA
jgi:hypothetical protein